MGKYTPGNRTNRNSVADFQPLDRQQTDLEVLSDELTEETLQVWLEELSAPVTSEQPREKESPLSYEDLLELSENAVSPKTSDRKEKRYRDKQAKQNIYDRTSDGG